MSALGRSDTYSSFISKLNINKLPKSKKVFDNSKVTDHHAIIPTNVVPTSLSDNERKLYDLIVRRFIAAFFPDCKFSTTTVLGECNEVEFKATGKEILEQGWREIFDKTKSDDENVKEEDEERILPTFEKGEFGPHTPNLAEKMTQPPKPYTEATLLRAMETAGKFVDNDELRDALKENGIGRPSTRAAIIETLYKRNYIRKERKSLFATPTGVELIATIDEELLKSAELTGQWENKLRKIEKCEYSGKDFLDELKQMVITIVTNVRNAGYKKITIEDVATKDNKKDKKQTQTKKSTTKKVEKKPAQKTTTLKEVKCPQCSKGILIKGRSAYGCSEWKNGCRYTIPFTECSADADLETLAKIINKKK
jgi:DNA topoisomerase-3